MSLLNIKLGLRIPIIFRIIGIIALFHALLGLMIGLAFFFIVPKIDSSQILNDPRFKEQISRHMDKLSEEEKAEINKFDMSEISKIMASEGFRSIFKMLTIGGLIFNILLAFVGFQMIQLRPNMLIPFIILMCIFGLYFHLLPKIISYEAELAKQFGGAWGIGNFGVALLYLSFFWIWGPVLAFISCRRMKAKS